jgi:RNA polymerase sigma-70 factor (ECF subfamily)
VTHFLEFSVTFANALPNVLPGSARGTRTERAHMDPERRQAIQAAMVRLSDGDRSAMEPLVRELWPVVLAFAARSLPATADAEDVAQEVFLKICARISDFDRSRDGVSWAFAMAGYEILTARRKRDRRREVLADALFERADLADSPEQALISHQLSAALALATGALSDDERRSLELVSSAADATIPAPTLRKRRQRAIERLRDLWRRLHGEP